MFTNVILVEWVRANKWSSDDAKTKAPDDDANRIRAADEIVPL